MNNDTYIGEWLDYEDTRLITLGELKSLTNSTYFTKRYPLSDYLDWRKSVNLQRFVFDPFTGEKIDWKKLREEAKAK